MSISVLGPKSVDNSPLSSLVKEWVKSVFRLDERVTVMVTELQCMEPGCPPVETIIAIMGQPGKPEQYKLHKMIAEVTFADIEKLSKSSLHDQTQQP